MSTKVETNCEDIPDEDVNSPLKRHASIKHSPSLIDYDDDSIDSDTDLNVKLKEDDILGIESMFAPGETKKVDVSVQNKDQNMVVLKFNSKGDVEIPQNVSNRSNTKRTSVEVLESAKHFRTAWKNIETADRNVKTQQNVQIELGGIIRQHNDVQYSKCDFRLNRWKDAVSMLTIPLAVLLISTIFSSRYGYNFTVTPTNSNYDNYRSFLGSKECPNSPEIIENVTGVMSINGGWKLWPMVLCTFILIFSLWLFYLRKVYQHSFRNRIKQQIHVCISLVATSLLIALGEISIGFHGFCDGSIIFLLAFTYTLARLSVFQAFITAIAICIVYELPSLPWYNVKDCHGFNAEDKLYFSPFLFSYAIALLCPGYYVHNKLKHDTNLNEEVEEQVINMKLETQLYDTTMQQMLPTKKLRDILESGSTVADQISCCSVMFAYVYGLDSEFIKPLEQHRHLNYLFSEFDDAVDNFDTVEKIKTIGCDYMCVSGIKKASRYHTENIADFAFKVIEIIKEYRSRPENEILRKVNLSWKIGIASGPAVGGVIGGTKFTYDVFGDTVNTASRMYSHSTEGNIMTVGKTAETLKKYFNVIPHPDGILNIKGKGPMQTYYIQGRKEDTLRPRERYRIKKKGTFSDDDDFEQKFNKFEEDHDIEVVRINVKSGDIESLSGGRGSLEALQRKERKRREKWIIPTFCVCTSCAFWAQKHSRKRFLKLTKLKHEESVMKKKHDQAQHLFEKMPIPPSVVRDLQAGKPVFRESFATVLFADIKSFTVFSGTVTAIQLVKILNVMFLKFDMLAKYHIVEKMKTIGDCYVAATGMLQNHDSEIDEVKDTDYKSHRQIISKKLSVLRNRSNRRKSLLEDSNNNRHKDFQNHAVRMVYMGLDMHRAMLALNSEFSTNLMIRVGIHSGHVMGGILGTKRLAFDIWGLDVELANEYEAGGVPKRVNVSEPTYQRAKGEFDFELRPKLMKIEMHERPTIEMKAYLVVDPVKAQQDAAEAKTVAEIGKVMKHLEKLIEEQGSRLTYMTAKRILSREFSEEIVTNCKNDIRTCLRAVAGKRHSTADAEIAPDKSAEPHTNNTQLSIE
eukprot:g726.t1